MQIFKLVTCLFTILTFNSISAQGTVSGTVTDDQGVPLPGASVVIAETNNGVTTDFDGLFLIETTSAVTLTISYVGYESKTTTATPGQELSIQLNQSNALDEVVITALGIRRAEKAIGYSVQGISGGEVAEVKTTNIINALSGKVAGVNITGSSAGPSASANITIRGATSLMGNNQPLFVVNGIPITNDLYSFDDGLNGSSSIDFGNAAQIINTDDIEAISVLKGPAASALYGSRAANGVILVETKTGKLSESGFRVDLSTNLQFGSPLKLPNYQNTYGSGGHGQYSYVDGLWSTGEANQRDAYGENWGPRMNGQLIKQFNSNGEAVPFTPSPNNVRDFYETTITSSTNVSVSSRSEDSFGRFSYTHLTNKGLIPNTDLQRNTFNTSFGRSLFDDKFSVYVNSMFVRSTSDNIPNTGYDESSSVMYGWLWFPRQVDIGDLRDYWQPGKEGVQQRYVENEWVNNPWFLAYENTNAFQSNRFISSIQMDYTFNEYANIRFRYGVDYVDEQRQYKRAPSTKAVLNGSYREDEISFRESNAELLLNLDFSPNEDNTIDVEAKFGTNLMSQIANFGIANNPELQIFGTDPSIYTLTNSRSGVLVESQKTNAKINSVFGLVSLDYKNKVYLDLTYRNDWTSSLVNPLVGKDQSNFSFSYPSASSSVLVHEIVDLPNEIGFFKVRASYAEVGNGAPAYSFGNTFTPQAAFGNNPAYATNRTISDPNLKNERTTASEIGFDIKAFDNILGLDLTFYKMNSFDQIISLPIAKTSGYDFTLTNGGEISNTGVEASLNINYINTADFKASSTINFGKNRAIVEELPDVITSGRYSIIADVFPGDEGGSDLELVAEKGKLLGQLYGLGFQRGPDGRIIHENGLPLITDEKVSAGSYQPDFRLGWYNEFSYKDLKFSFLFDGQVGGKIYSRSHALYATGGAITNEDDPNLNLTTMEGRNVYSVSYDGDGAPVYTAEPGSGVGVVGPGWMYDGSGNLVENNVAVPPGGAAYTGYFYNYYGNGFNRDNIEAATYDATYFKLREVSFSYNLTDKLASSLGFSYASVSIIGRNLLLFSKVPTIDPETYSIRNGIFVNGFESTSIPSTRSFGVNVKLGF
ncbi:MAG: SusC/RagA family TonB-linked outer membrane protein [Flavobacteriaceae bacterium]|nr:SusC/RagA family TonB-linked outer membrane protein [Flavobacteriaceae bacterium]